MRFVVQAAQPDPQLLAHARIERAERLVEQQDLGVDRECAGQAHALSLPAGELRGIALRETAELDELEQFGDALLDLARAADDGSCSPKATLSHTVMCLKAA